MKRRELLTRLFTFSIASMAMPSLIAKELNNGFISRVYPYKPELKVYFLVDDPMIYETVETLSFSKDQVPIKVVTRDSIINGQENEVIITESGDYNFQFLGPYYGWHLS